MANLLATFIGSGALPEWAFAHELPSDAEERVGYLMSLGEPPAVAALLADLIGEIPNSTRVTMPRGTPASQSVRQSATRGGAADSGNRADTQRRHGRCRHAG